MEDFHVHWDIPIFQSNLRSYERIYVLEQWLRRLVYVALTAELGKEWRSAIPANINKNLKRRLNDTRNLSYLQCESEKVDNEIWLTTLEEILAIADVSKSKKAVEKISGYTYKVLSREIEKLIEIRNVVAHNKPVSEDTFEILESISKILNGTYVKLRGYIFGYTSSEEFSGKLRDRRTQEETEDPVADMFHLRMKQHGIKLPYMFFGASDYFYHFEYVYIEEEAETMTYVQIPVLLNNLKSIIESLTAITAGVKEYNARLVWPKVLGLDEQVRILDTAFRITETHALWGEEAIERQDPFAIANPMIWLDL